MIRDAYRKLEENQKQLVRTAIGTLKQTTLFDAIRSEIQVAAVGICQGYAGGSVNAEDVMRSAMRMTLCEALLQELAEVAAEK